LGIPALLLRNASKGESEKYFPAVQRQLNQLLNVTPRFANNAISHRDAYPSLWADFIYMVPPFLAYYGVFKDDIEYLKDAVRQCELYHEVLVTESGCWKHIVNPEGVEGEDVKVDEGLWSTSNGWAAAGMARVLATIRKSRFAGELEKEQGSLAGMTQGILDGAMKLDTDASGLLRNRLDDESWFGEAAGTALLAAAAFRMAVLEPAVFGDVYTDWALRKMMIVKKCVDEETGIVAPVVNPTTDDQRTPLDGVSPEAQSFVVLLYAAWKDFNEVNDRNAAQHPG
jgi:rhamnogalacturonyl hydrolase YesR